MKALQWMVFFIGAGFLGTFGDLLHVESNTLEYPPSFIPVLPLGGQPLWVPFLFGFAGVMIGGSHVLLRRLPATQPRPRLTLANVAVGVILLIAFWGASGFLPLQTGGGKDVFMALGAVGFWLALDRSAWGLLLGLSTAAVGTAFEIGLAGTGAFHYLPHAANFFGVPTWLPSLYIIASVATGNLGLKLFQGSGSPHSASGGQNAAGS